MAPPTVNIIPKGPNAKVELNAAPASLSPVNAPIISIALISLSNAFSSLSKLVLLIILPLFTGPDWTSDAFIPTQSV